MIISAHQPAYNPWLGLIHKILVADIFVVMDDVQFEKNSFINRNKILQNSNEIMLTIPIKTKNYHSKILKEMEVSDDKWKHKHLKSIEQSYRKSKNFDMVFQKLKNIYSIESKYLIDYTNAYLELIVDFMEVKTRIVFASDLNITAKKLDYVCELTKKLNGTIFIFGSQGKGYADTNYLKKQDIAPYFQDYRCSPYPQMTKKFHPYMGVIDLLFNENKDNLKNIILSNNIIKSDLESMNV